MLMQFRFKNFKSFKDDTILDLSATKITEYVDRIVCVGNEKILPTAAIFGANASGKSNVIKAFRFMMNYVVNSFAFGGSLEDKKSNSPGIQQTPFLFDIQSKEEVSSFEVYFVDHKSNSCKSYNYGFTLGKKGIVEEWLNSKAKTARAYKRIFYRSPEELDLSGIPSKVKENIEIALEKETLVVSLGAKLKIAKLKMIRDWFYNNEVVDFGNPYENAVLSTFIPKKFVENEELQREVVSYLSTFDPSIIRINVEVMKDNEEDIKHIKIDAVHRTLDGGTATIPLKEESDGTLKMFSLYPALRSTLDIGGVLFVDELNARLHPLLVRNFIITFLNPEINKNHAQLIFTTHDSWQLSNNLLRRDEIWFTEKDNNGISSLYSLADFIDDDGSKIRKDASYEKNYLLGKYGAIPFLKSINMLGEK
ncbi:ATP/GTP-binding protein [uncultured Phascolarctobacterium sp.]|uniref:AAA family ATPase n=1 Tax=uncultured Phascolarctobacterium sp. TaxID=512296 RepID=UPI0025EAED14|nr:ATP-binding protein [uncultured Phascolarctobacterium sp.]